MLGKVDADSGHKEFDVGFTKLAFTSFHTAHQGGHSKKSAALSRARVP
jgi:hypothetical protein